MSLTFSSLFTTTFYSSFLIILVYFVLKKESRIRRAGVRTLIICILLSLIKLMFPYEFFFSRNINLTFFYPKIYQFINSPFEIIPNKTVLPLDILCFVWCVGIIFFLMRHIVTYIRMSVYIKNLEMIKDNRLYSLLDSIIDKKRLHIHFRFVSSEMATSPYIFGLFRPYIVLPKTFDIDSQNLYFIISHEIAHYYNGDLLLKFVLSLLKAVYWWNPLIHLLQKQLVRLLEINIDSTVTHNWPESQKLNYLICLVESAKENLIVPCKDEILSFQSGDSSMISQRAKFLLEDIDAPVKTSLPGSAFLLFLSVFLFFTPVFTTFEAWHAGPEIQEDYFEVNSQNAFYIDNGNGTFDLYIGSNYIGTITEIFNPAIPIKERGIQNEIQ